MDGNKNYSIEILRKKDNFTAIISELGIKNKSCNLIEAIEGVLEKERELFQYFEESGIELPCLLVQKEKDLSIIQKISDYFSWIFKFIFIYILVILSSLWIGLLITPHIKISLIDYLQSQNSKDDLNKISSALGYKFCLKDGK
jgi:hypothetical protein